MILAVVATCSSLPSAVAPTTQQAAAFEAKMNTIIARGEARPAGYRTEFAEEEVNAYLQFRLASKLPTGVADPSVTLEDQGRLGGRAIVDTSAITETPENEIPLSLRAAWWRDRSWQISSPRTDFNRLEQKRQRPPNVLISLREMHL